MDVKVYNNKENYDNFKDEVLNDFNYFGQGIHDAWVSEEKYINIKNVYNFV